MTPIIKLEVAEETFIGSFIALREAAQQGFSHALQVDADGDVWSGGQVQTVVTGSLDW